MLFQGSGRYFIDLIRNRKPFCILFVAECPSGICISGTIVEKISWPRSDPASLLRCGVSAAMHRAC